MSESLGPNATLAERQRHINSQITENLNFDPTAETSWAVYHYTDPDDTHIEHEVAIIIDNSISLSEDDPPLLRVIDQAAAGIYFTGDVLVRDISMLGVNFAQYNFGLYEEHDKDGLNGVISRFWLMPDENRLKMSEAYSITMPSEVSVEVTAEDELFGEYSDVESLVVAPFGKYDNPMDMDYAIRQAQKILDVITKDGQLIDFSGRTR